MSGNAVCSEMVLTGLARDYFIFNSISLLLERYIQRPDLYYEVQVGLEPFKTFFHFELT